MKRIFLALLINIALIAPVSVFAAKSASVTITVMGYIAESPQGLVVTYVDDSQLYLNWATGEDSVQTDIRAMYGRPVVDRSDGFSVYLGIGTNASHYVQNVGYEPIYYKGFSQRADGLWEEHGTATVEGNFMSISFMFIGIILLIIAMMTLSFTYKYTWLFIMTGFLWFGIGVYALNAYYAGGVSSNSLYMVVGYSGLGMMATMFIIPFVIRPAHEEKRIMTDSEVMQNEYNDYNKLVDSYRGLKVNKRRTK
jgi:hypothetical protein